MTSFPLLFLAACVVLTLVLRKAWAPIPLLAVCCYMTTGQGIEVGPVSLPAFRVILAAGLLRVILRREAPTGGLNAVDVLVLVWAAWTVFAGFFHVSQPGSGPLFASGFAFNVVLIYFLARVWCTGEASMLSLARAIAWLLVPVALSMLAEHVTHRNLFGVLIGEGATSVFVRDGQVRAQGPFSHPILAGVVGAVNLPLMIALLRDHRISAVAGLLACLCMVLASTSSAPLISLVAGVMAVSFWSIRKWLSAVRWGALGLYGMVALVLPGPAYYIMARIDLTGSSTGWHRAYLIEMAIFHFHEWWLFGADYTAHWMPYALDGGRHADITNYYLWIGIIGGFLAMALVTMILVLSFVWVGKCVRADSAADGAAFSIWCVGSCLFSAAITGLSVSFMDQSMIFFWLSVGTISSAFMIFRSSDQLAPAEQSENVEDPQAGRRAARLAVPRYSGRTRIKAVALRRQRIMGPRIPSGDPR